MTKKFEHIAATLGVWIEGILNVAVTLGIMLGIPFYVWHCGAHWILVALSVPVCFLASGLVAERVLFKLTWAEKIFGKPERKTSKGPSTYEWEMARRTKKRYIDFTDRTTEIQLSDSLLGVDLDTNSFTIEEQSIGLMEVDLFELARKGKPEQNLKMFHIDETGIRITQQEGPGAFYEYSDIEKMELGNVDADPDSPRPIHSAFELTFEAGGNKYRLPITQNDGNAAAWFATRQFKKLREREYRKILAEGGEICIGKDVINRLVYLSAKGFRSKNTAIPVEKIWRVVIQPSGTVDVIGKTVSYSLPFDYGNPDSYLFLELIKEMVIPRAIPITDKEVMPGARNKHISYQRMGWSLFFSLVSFAIAGFFVIKGASARSWTETYGTVQSHRIEDVEWGDEDGPFTIGYELIVSYKYEVDGANYTNETFKYGKKFFHFKKMALKLAADYAEGRVVPVYYNPNDPKQSVLEWGFGYYGYVFLFFGVFSFIFVIYYKASFKKAEELRRRVKGHW